MVVQIVIAHAKKLDIVVMVRWTLVKSVTEEVTVIVCVIRRLATVVTGLKILEKNVMMVIPQMVIDVMHHV